MGRMERARKVFLWKSKSRCDEKEGGRESEGRKEGWDRVDVCDSASKERGGGERRLAMRQK